MTRQACAHIHHAIGYLLAKDWARARIELEDAMDAWIVGDSGRMHLYKIMETRESRGITMREVAKRLSAIVDGRAGDFE